MKTRNTKIFGLCLLAAITSCVKDELYKTPHPDKGAIVVQIDWSDVLPEAVTSNYILNIDGIEQTVSGTVNIAESLYDEGEHTLMVYNKPEGITISDGIAYLNQVTETRAIDDTFYPNPGILVSQKIDVFIKKDGTTEAVVVPRQWVRQLNVALTVVEGDPTRISDMRATLTGAEGAVNLIKNERTGTPVTVANDFTVENNKCSTAFNLMGIVPTEVQIMTVTFRFTDGETLTIEKNFSGKLADFNNDNDEANINDNVGLPIEVGFTGSINGWTVVDNGVTDIH